MNSEPGGADWRRRDVVRIVILPVLLLALAACDAVTISPESTPVLPVDFTLPTIEPIVVPPGAVEGCAGVGSDAVLHGDPRDPHVAWLVATNGTRIDVVWPAGYHARFTPQLEVLDASGNLVLREGSPVDGGCVTREPGVLLLMPPFR